MYIVNWIMDDTLKLISINCQGLQTVEKRKYVFNYLRAKHCTVYLIQDTHFTKDPPQKKLNPVKVGGR